MIFDGRKASEDLPQTAYDLVIVGAGPAGIALANELKDTGLKIALLESGGEDFDGDAQDLNEGRIEGNDNYDLSGSRLRFFGGTSNHWGGQCTPLDPIDFERAPPGFSGWPFAYTEMEPYWQRAHDYCDIGAYRYDARELAPQDPDLWLFNDTDDVDTVVLRQSAPTRFGEKYREALAASDTVHLWLWTTATKVSTRPGLAGETVETQTLDGKVRAFTARAVVLASGAIEATRLLIWSNAENGTTVGDAGSLLGRCYMDHLAGGIGFLHFNQPVKEKVYWGGIEDHSDAGTNLHFGLRLSEKVLAETGLTNAYFAPVPLTEDVAGRVRREKAKRGLQSLRQLAKWGLGRTVEQPFDAGDAYCTVVNNADDLIGDRVSRMISGGGAPLALLRYEAEERPGRSSHVELDPQARDALGMPSPVLTWKPSDDDIEGVRQSAIILGQVAGATGLGRIELEDQSDEPYWGIVTAWHQLGTMRMAESPTSGVTDPNGKVHGAGALYVASGALFPTAGRANPTLTIVALSIRLGAHLKERLGT